MNEKKKDTRIKIHVETFFEKASLFRTELAGHEDLKCLSIGVPAFLWQYIPTEIEEELYLQSSTIAEDRKARRQDPRPRVYSLSLGERPSDSREQREDNKKVASWL